MLAAVWKLNPTFPDNLPLAALSSWLTLVACLLAARVAFRDLGAGPNGAWVLCGVLALSPYYALCGISLLSELLFACLSLAALALIERARAPASGAGLAVLAGLVASAACLTRSTGLVRPDAVALYYTDYLGYWIRDGTAQNLAVVLWRNLDNLLLAIGGMFVFGLEDSFAGKSVPRVLAVAAIVGTARLWRRSGATAYLLFTAGCLLALLFWNFSPDQRFIVPVFPVLLAGFSAELLRLAGKLRAAFLKGPPGERMVAGALSLSGGAARAGGRPCLCRPVLGVAGVRGPAAGHAG